MIEPACAQAQIDKLRDETARARAEASVRAGAGVDAERLDRALGELALAVKAVQRMMVEKGVCSPPSSATSCTSWIWKTAAPMDGCPRAS